MHELLADGHTIRAIARHLRPQLKALLDRCRELQAADGHVRAFATMLTRPTGQDLPEGGLDPKFGRR